jgi:hypothetical protein
LTISPQRHAQTNHKQVDYYVVDERRRQNKKLRSHQHFNASPQSVNTAFLEQTKITTNRILAKQK